VGRWVLEGLTEGECEAVLPDLLQGVRATLLVQDHERRRADPLVWEGEGTEDMTGALDGGEAERTGGGGGGLRCGRGSAALSGAAGKVRV